LIDSLKSDLLFDPELNTRTQLIWLNEFLHEINLVNANLQKEACEFDKSLFT